MEEEKRSKERWLNKNIFGMGLTSLFSDMGHEMVTALLPAVLASLGAPPLALGAVEGVSDLCASLAKLWAGWYTDHINRRPRKLLVVAGYAATGFKGLIALAVSWPQVLLLRVLGWTGRGLRSPLRDAMMADSANPDTYGRVFGFHRFMDTLGAVAGPLIVVLLLRETSLKNILFLSLVPGSLAFLCFGLLVKDKSSRPKNRENLPGLLKVLPSPFLRFVSSAGIFGLGNFAPTFLILQATQVLKGSLGSVGATVLAVSLYTLHNLVYAAGSYPVGVLADRHNKKRLLAGGYFLFALVCLALVLLPKNLLSFVLIFILAGASVAVVDATEGAIAAHLLPADLRGTGFGLLSAVNGLGDFVSSLTVGTLWTLFSPAVAFTYGAILALAGTLLMYYPAP